MPGVSLHREEDRDSPDRGHSRATRGKGRRRILFSDAWHDADAWNVAQHDDAWNDDAWNDDAHGWHAAHHDAPNAHDANDGRDDAYGHVNGQSGNW